MAIGPWGGFSNGAIPASAMNPAGGVLLRPSTAAQCQAWVANCLKRGVTLVFNEGYRDLATQAYWLRYYNGDTRYAATPGTSNHGWGQAVDINVDGYTADEYQAIVAEGARCGMIPNISLESWHFADAGTVTASLNVTAFDNTTPILEEDDMPIYYRASTPNESPSAYVAVGDIFIQDGAGPLRLVTAEEWDARSATKAVGGLAATYVNWNVASITDLIAQVGVYGKKDKHNDYTQILF